MAPSGWRPPLRSLQFRASRWVASSSYGRKWLVLGIVIGVTAGLGAVVFYEALRAATHLFLGVIAGYTVPTPVGEGGSAASAHFARPWAIPLVACLGALVGAVLVFEIAPEAEGHGTDAAIAAVHHNPRGIRLRTVAVKIVASALTIGSGGSGGREGPTGQISAGFGSFLSRLLDLSPADARIAVASGIGSGIGSIFGAPLGGAVLATEIMYRDDFEVEALLPSFIASIVGYVVFGSVEGFSPLFGICRELPVDRRPTALVVRPNRDPRRTDRTVVFQGLLWHRRPLCAASDAPLGPAGDRRPDGRVYRTRCPRGPRDRLRMDTGEPRITTPRRSQLWIVLVLPFARIVTTGLSIGSGGSGGIFGPGMVIGAFVGAAIWRLFEPIVPSLGHDPAPYVIVGMMSCFGSISRAPLAVMLMVAEMTGTLSLIVPAMVAVGLATLIVRRSDDTIYRSQLRSRADSPAHRILTGLPLLASSRACDAMATPRCVVPNSADLTTARGMLEQSGVEAAPFVDSEGHYLGVVTLDAVREGNEEPEAPAVASLVDNSYLPILQGVHLDVVLDTLTSTPQTWMAVVDDERKVIGTIATSDLIASYRRSLQASLRRVSEVSESSGMLDVVVADGSPIIGTPLRAAPIPPGVLITAIERGREVIRPTGDTVIWSGDRLMALGTPEDLARLKQLAATAPA